MEAGIPSATSTVAGVPSRALSTGPPACCPLYRYLDQSGDVRGKGPVVQQDLRSKSRGLLRRLTSLFCSASVGGDVSTSKCPAGSSVEPAGATQALPTGELMWQAVPT